MKLVDTHCHLDAHYFPGGPEPVLLRAKQVGVVGFVVVGVGADLGPAKAAIELAKKHPQRVAATVGIHPHEASSGNEVTLEELHSLAREPCVVAIGEVGLDYHYDHSPRKTQRDVFARLIGVARELGKPIVVHTREASEDTLRILEEERARDVGGIIHCFSEGRAFATRALDLNFDLSFSGVVTFKAARDIHDVARWAPLDRILVETDSPYLAPVPHRGKPNEPAYVVFTASRLAELRAMPLELLAEATTQNAERRFRRPFAGEPEELAGATLGPHDRR
ncbi:MAG: TatD family hydrolase [Myxococcales bacterium]